MRALLRHLFDAVTAMSLIAVIGSVSVTDEPRPRGSDVAADRGESKASPVLEVPPPRSAEPRREPPPLPRITVAANESTRVPRSHDQEPRQEPVSVAAPRRDRIVPTPLPIPEQPTLRGADPTPDTEPAPAPRKQEEPPTPPTRPYLREPVRPHCTPSRAAILEYWRVDLIRARHMARVCSDAQVRRVLGAAYAPLMDAVRRGANGFNNTPEPPDCYANVIISRHELGGCSNGVCRTAGDGFTPLPGEAP